MNRKWLSVIVAAAALSVFSVMPGLVPQASAATYFIYANVFDADGTSGTASTENSNAGLRAYRQGIPGEIAQEYSADPVYPARIDPAYFEIIPYPASFNDDVGDTDWPSPVTQGQVIVAICQTYDGQFGWAGGSYAGARKKTVTGGFAGSDVSNSKSLLPDIQLQLVPVPQVSTIGASDVSLTWTGIACDPDNLIQGYTVYRSTEPGGAGGFGEIGTAAQAQGTTVSFNDAGLSVLYTYYYCIAVNFEWGGGAAPAYYVSDAKSAVSSGVYTANSPTPTQEISPSRTQTMAPSLTYTYTATEEDTETYTPTYTDTVTETITETVTKTATETITITPSPTLTFTQTCTSTPTSQLYVNITAEKMIILNSPIKNGRLQLGIFAEGAGNVFLYAYNISGELVYREMLSVSAGPNVFDREFKKARGVYILRAVLKTTAGTKKMPLNKFAVVRNDY